MSLLRRNTAAALDKARVDLAALATAIAELQQRRDAALADDDGIDQVAAIDRQADEQGRKLRALQDKISLLESRLADEQEEQRGRDFVAAVAAIEKLLAVRTQAAVGLEKALADVGVAAKRCTSAVLEAWPEDVSFPSRAYPGHLLSLGRLGALVESLFVGFEIVNPRTKLRVQPAEFVARVTGLAERVRLTAFAATERELANEWLADLKTARDPPPVEPEPEVENENAEAAG
jgi:hypothetical protein